MHHQQLQHLLPRHLAGNVLEPLRPEPLQPQLLPQPTAQPAVPERPWPPQLHRRQPHLYAVQGVGRNRPVLREQTQLSALLPALVEDLQTLPPCRLLRIVDLAQIQDGSLHDLAAGHPAVLDDAEVAMRFAVLPPILASQEHGPIFGPLPIPINTVGLHYSGFDAPYDGTTETYARKFLRKWQKDARRAKVGLAIVRVAAGGAKLRDGPRFVHALIVWLGRGVGKGEIRRGRPFDRLRTTGRERGADRKWRGERADAGRPGYSSVEQHPPAGGLSWGLHVRFRCRP